MAARLIIEVDGSQHGSEAGVARDKSRTAWFEARGYRVIRFWNNEISSDIDGVVAAIHAALYGSVDTEPTQLKHRRLRKFLRTSPHPVALTRADPPLPGEGNSSSSQ
jgi:very-short-patch-repair endonuclease